MRKLFLKGRRRCRLALEEGKVSMVWVQRVYICINNIGARKDGRNCMLISATKISQIVRAIETARPLKRARELQRVSQDRSEARIGLIMNICGNYFEKYPSSRLEGGVVSE